MEMSFYTNHLFPVHFCFPYDIWPLTLPYLRPQSDGHKFNADDEFMTFLISFMDHKK